MRFENPKGNYVFLKGIEAFSSGAVAAAGFEIEHARLGAALPWRAGFLAVEAHLRSLGRPRQALCGIELRSPRPFSYQGFDDFNAGYAELLKTWDIPCDGRNPVARTNVAPEVDPPSEPLLYGFSYTVPSDRQGSTFVVAGGGEPPEARGEAATLA